jgi:hypothetical protein
MVVQFVDVPCYKLEGLGFDSRLCHWILLKIIMEPLNLVIGIFCTNVRIFNLESSCTHEGVHGGAVC